MLELTSGYLLEAQYKFDITLPFWYSSSMKTTVKLQIPLDKSLRDKVEKHARDMGFSSVQDFTRVMYSAVIRNNMQFKIASALDVSLKPETEKRYKEQLKSHIADKKAGNVKSYNNVDDLISDLSWYGCVQKGYRDRQGIC